MATGFVGLFEDAFAALYGNFSGLLPGLLFFITVLVIIFAIYFISSKIIKGTLRRTVRKREQVKNILAIWRYAYLFIALLTMILVFSGDLAATGLSIGLLSAALGWALQKPITGIAGWLMVVVKRPFKVGDRIIIGDTKGDVLEITMFYIVLNEIGGTIGGEEKSGRGILVPTSTLFDQKITNYSFENEFILDEVGAEYTYKSNLAKVEKIIIEAATKATKHYSDKVQQKPFSRVFFNPNGMHVKVRYYVAVKERQLVMTDITREIYNKVMKEQGTVLAYPHTERVFKKETPLKVV